MSTDERARAYLEGLDLSAVRALADHYTKLIEEIDVPGYNDEATSRARWFLTHVTARWVALTSS